MIEMSHVYKVYPGQIQALKNIDLHIDQGEFVYLTGPSGSGKTTLFKMLSAFDRPTSGTLKVVGFDLQNISAKDQVKFRSNVGIVFQDFKLLKDRTLQENVALPLTIQGVSSKEAMAKSLQILEKVGLASKADQYPDFVSGGEQQRTAIARAIVHQPKLLIADEPTGNLDPQLSEDIMDLFEKVSSQGTTVFIATHDHSMVQRRKKRTLEIKDGLLKV